MTRKERVRKSPTRNSRRKPLEEPFETENIEYQQPDDDDFEYEILQQQEEEEKEQARIEELRRKFIETVSPHQREIRDKLLTYSIMIETDLEGTIAWHFCKTQKMVYIFTTNLLGPGFGRKQDLLKSLVENLHSDLYEQIKDMFPTMKEITKLRNAIAHSNFMVPDFDEYLSEEEIKYYYSGEEYKAYQNRFRNDGLTFTNRGKREFYSLEKMNSLNKKAKGVLMLLEKLQTELKRRARGETPQLLDDNQLRFAKKYLSGKGLEFPPIIPPRPTKK